jgi:hypothetical protein
MDTGVTRMDSGVALGRAQRGRESEERDATAAPW